MAYAQISPYQPIAFYDAPGVAFTQIVDGEASFSSLVRTVTGQDHKLTPLERDSFSDRLKARFGGDKISDTLIDLATNPLVLLGFLFIPGAVSALSKGGRVFSSFGRKSVLPHVLKSGHQLLDGTPGAWAIKDALGKGHDLTAAWRQTLQSSEIALMKRLGLDGAKGFDLAAIKDTARREETEKVLLAMEAKLAGRDMVRKRAVADYVPYFEFGTVKGGRFQTVGLVEDRAEWQALAQRWNQARHGRFGEPLYYERDGISYHVRPRRKGKLVDWTRTGQEFQAEKKMLADSAQLDQVFQQYPEAAAYVESLRNAMSDRLAHYLMKEGVNGSMLRSASQAGRDLAEYVDEGKVYSLWRAAQEGSLYRKGEGAFDMLDDLFMPGHLRMVAKGKMGHDRFLSIIRQGISRSIDPEYYVPRNVSSWFGVKDGALVKLKEAEMAAMSGNKPGRLVSGRFLPRKAATPVYSEESLRKMSKHFDLDPEFLADQAAMRKKLLRTKGDGPIGMVEIDLVQNIDRLERQTNRDIVMHLTRPSAETIKAQKEVFEGLAARGVTFPEGLSIETTPGGARVPLMRAFDNDEVMGGWNLGHVLKQTEALLETSTERKYLTDTLVPSALGTLHHDHAVTRHAIQLAQVGAGRLAKGPIGEVLERGAGKYGKSFREKLLDFSEADAERLTGRTLSGGAGWIYSSTLGANMGSVMLNLQQPFLHTASIVGPKNTVKGWNDALKEMGAYLKERVKHPLRIDQATKRDILYKTTAYPEQYAIMGDLLDEIDQIALQEYGKGKRGKFRWWVQDVPMKAFEKAEMLNRMTAVHAMKHAYKGQGMATTGSQFLLDAERLVDETQFAASTLNTPMLFMSNALGSNPLVRQFQTFTLRAPAAFLSIGPRVNEGVRETVWGGSAPWWVGDGAKALATSAVIYEVAKNMLGWDVSRGGFVASMTDPIGGDRFLEASDATVKLPPFLGISGQYVRAALNQNAEMLGDAVARTVPGGVAIQRALRAAPEMTGSTVNSVLGGLPSAMQKTYADWRNPLPDGRVPLHKADGTLLEFTTPSELVLRSLGISPGAPDAPAVTDRWLLENRTQFLEARAQYMKYMAARDWRKAKGVQDDFMKRFGIPLSLSKTNVRNFTRERSVPRTERIVDRFPLELREQYRQMLLEQRMVRGSPLAAQPYGRGLLDLQ